MFCSIIEETEFFLLIKSISIEKQRFANSSMFWLTVVIDGIKYADESENRSDPDR